MTDSERVPRCGVPYESGLCGQEIRVTELRGMVKRSARKEGGGRHRPVPADFLGSISACPIHGLGWHP